MKTFPVILVCLFIMIGSAITYVAHASEWRRGTDAEINYVMWLVYQDRAAMRGNPSSGNWQWKCLDKNGCGR